MGGNRRGAIVLIINSISTVVATEMLLKALKKIRRTRVKDKTEEKWNADLFRIRLNVKKANGIEVVRNISEKRGRFN